MCNGSSDVMTVTNNENEEKKILYIEIIDIEGKYEMCSNV